MTISEDNRAVQLDSEIDDLIKNHLESIDQHPDAIPEVLYQYTDGAAVLSMLKHRRIWATDAAFLNDYGETRYVWSELTDFASSLSGGSPAETMAQQLILRLAQSRRIVGHELYVASFSSEPDMLSQWRAYASDGSGYALGLRLREVPSVSDLAPELDKQVFGPVLAKVVYDQDRQQASLRRLVDVVEMGMRAAQDGLSEERAKYTVVAGLARMISLLSIYFKHPGFREEKEWRLVWACAAPTVHEELHRRELLRFRSTALGIAPHLDWPLCDESQSFWDCIGEIWIGPRFDHEACEASASRMLACLGAPEGAVRISCSATTYR